MSILKSKGIINSFVSRAHGFDLYEKRSKIKIIPFRKFQLKNVKDIFLISKDGVDYIRKKYPKYNNKYKLSYLGTKDYGLSIFKSNESVNILTVSNLIPVKRVLLLIEALNKVSIKVNWTHFGDGELQDHLKNKAKELPKNINVSFKGRIPNSEMLEFIKNNHFDVFINVSESEGLPVSIMEAVSLGIPVFATDAGGTKEIVNEQTGRLFSNNLNVDELALAIENLKNSKYSTLEFRKGIREYWKLNFEADKNYDKFANKLINI